MQQRRDVKFEYWCGDGNDLFLTHYLMNLFGMQVAIPKLPFKLGIAVDFPFTQVMTDGNTAVYPYRPKIMSAADLRHSRSKYQKLIPLSEMIKRLGSTMITSLDRVEVKPKERWQWNPGYSDIDLQYVSGVEGTINLPSASQFMSDLRKTRDKAIAHYQSDAFGDFWEARQKALGTFGGKDPLKALDYFVGQVIGLNTLLILTATEHNDPMCREPGRLAGLAKEILLFEQRVPMEQWPDTVQYYVLKAIEAVREREPTLLPLARPGDPLGKRGPRREDSTPSDWKPYDDWSRLLFYMKVKGYQELRCTEHMKRSDDGENVSPRPYEYIAVVLQGNDASKWVVSLDTVEVGHAGLVLIGAELNSLVRLAEQRVSVIRAAPEFHERLVHSGEWEVRLREILMKALWGEGE